MFVRSVIKATGQVKNVTSFGTSGALRYGKQVSSPTDVSPQKPKTPDPETVLGPKMHKCSNFDKWLLVWVKRYPSKDQIPEKIGQELYLRVQSQARIKTANIMIVLTIIGCIGAVISGKREAKAGNTLHKQNLDWHKKINEEYRKEQAAAAAAAGAGADVKTT